MEWWQAALFLIGAVLVLLASGLPISFAMGSIGVFGLLLVGGPEQVKAMALWSYGTMNNFILIALPLFILMAEMMGFTGLTGEVYDALQKWLRRLPAGLGVATISGCAIFAAASGVSVANAATMGRVAIPPMLERGYEKKITTGLVAAGGTLGILIPPSIPLILYAQVTEESIGRLYMAGFIPGVMMAVIFSLYLMGIAIFRPHLIPPVTERATWGDRLRAIPTLLPIGVLIIAVLGSMYFGIATPTEAAAIGCLVVLALAAIRGRLAIVNLRTSLLSTVETTSFILLIVAAILSFGYLLTILNIPQELSRFVIGLGISKWIVIWIFIALYFLMGMFLDTVSIILLSIPVLYPVIKDLGFDPIWFGILLVLNLEVGLLTPPVGMNVYVIAGQVERYGIKMWEVFQGIWPFVILLLLGMGILMVFPQLALWLPSTMK